MTPLAATLARITANVALLREIRALDAWEGDLARVLHAIGDVLSHTGDPTVLRLLARVLRENAQANRSATVALRGTVYGERVDADAALFDLTAAVLDRAARAAAAQPS